MEILIAAAHVPACEARHGGGRTSFHVCAFLARKHRLHLLSFASKEGSSGLQESDLSIYASSEIIPVTNLSRLLGVVTSPHLPLAVSARNSWRFRRALRSFLASQQIDVVLLDHAAMYQYAEEFPPSTLVGGSAHDVILQSWARRSAAATGSISRWLLTAEAERVRVWETRMIERLDFVLAHNEKDRSLILQACPCATVMVIDPWVSVVPGRGTRDAEPASLLYWGAMNRPENLDAVRWAAAEILPLIRKSVPEAKLHIAGSHSEALSHEFSKRDDISIIGFVSDIAGMMARMQIALLPLRQGAGIKIKTLECMAAGMPVVTTSVGEEGVGGTVSEHYLVGRTAVEIANLTVSLLRNPTEARRMGNSARRFMEARENFVGRLAGVEAWLEERLAQSRI